MGITQCKLIPLDATIPPTIVVQRLVTVSLPQHLVILNASKSHDDFGIASYQWIPYPQNLAIGVSSVHVMHHVMHCVASCDAVEVAHTCT